MSTNGTPSNYASRFQLLFALHAVATCGFISGCASDEPPSDTVELDVTCADLLKAMDASCPPNDLGSFSCPDIDPDLFRSCTTVCEGLCSHSDASPPDVTGTYSAAPVLGGETLSLVLHDQQGTSIHLAEPDEMVDNNGNSLEPKIAAILGSEEHFSVFLAHGSITSSGRWFHIEVLDGLRDDCSAMRGAMRRFSSNDGSNRGALENFDLLCQHHEVP